jgi:hypothetical protein
VFVRAKHSHWQNTDLQVNRSIIHLSIIVEKRREEERERKEKKKKASQGQ